MAVQLVPEVQIVTLKVQPMTVESFAPYGELIDTVGTVNLDFGGGRPSLCPLIAEFRPFRLDFIGRHKRTTQTYIPLGGVQSIIVVAPPGDPKSKAALPDATKIAAFLNDGKSAFNLHRGTWHRTPFPLAKEAKFLVLDRDGTLEDFDLVDLRSKLNMVFEFTL